MRVSDLLRVKGADVATIESTATVAEVVAELARRRIGALVVSGDRLHIEGIVSERDVVRRMASARHDISTETVAAIMSSDVHTCGPEDDIDHLMSMMTERRVRHVPVVSDGVLAGLVSIGDVVKSRIEELERERRELVEYITAR